MIVKGIILLMIASPLIVFLTEELQSIPSNARYEPETSIIPAEPLSVSVSLSSNPVWITGEQSGDGVIWTVLLEDDAVKTIKLAGGTRSVANTEPNPKSRILKTPYREDNELRKTLIDPIPDAVPIKDGAGRILYLAHPTSAYPHGVLGDTIEAKGFVIMDTSNTSNLVDTRIEDSVIEGLYPLWVDFDGDGEEEIIVTVSDEDNGARIRAYDDAGNLKAEGPAIGTGYRWRHHLTVAPLGPKGELELAVVRTPHIGGIVEFYRLVGDRLEIVASIPGFSTHVFGSRNLDMFSVADFDGDGVVELVVPSQDLASLMVLKRIGDSVKPVLSFNLDGKLSSNVEVFDLGGGRLLLGAGSSNSFNVWDIQA